MADLNAWGDTVAERPAPSGGVPEASTGSTSGWGDDQSAPLAGSIKYGSQVPPEQAAKVLKLQSQTGLPTDIIHRNLEEVDNLSKTQVDPVELQKQSPNLASWIAENYLHYSIAGPDLYNLHSIEGLAKDVGAGIYRGSLEMQRSALGLKSLFGMEEPEDAGKVAEIERKVAGAQSSEAPSIYGTVAEQAPIMAAATGAGGAAALLGGAGVGAAGVATAASVARGALFGASTAGGAYLDYQKLRDENNQPLDPQLNRGAALTTGIINSILQEKVFSNIAEKVPAFQSLIPDGMKAMLQSPTMRAAIGNYLLKIGETSAGQGGVSWITSMAKSGGGELAKMVSDGSIHNMSPGAILSTIFNPEAIKQAAKEAKSGIATGAAMGAGFSAYDFAKNYSDIVQATDSAKSYEDIGNRIQNLKMLEHSPEKTEEVIKRIVGGPEGDGPNRNTYVPIRDFNEHYQGKDVDPREAFRAITGSYDGYDESSRTGADLQIPTEKYLTTIGVVPEDNKALSQSMRTDPAAMNAQEAEKAAELIKKARGEAQEQPPEERIKDAMVVPQPLPAAETEPITPAQEKPSGPPEQQAVEAVHERQGFKPLFENADRILPPEEAAKYNRAVEEVHARAQEEIASNIVDQQLRTKSRAWNNERDDIKDQVLADISQRKEYHALDFLRQPSETTTEQGVKTFKLSRRDVEENDPTNSTRGYPTGIMADDGVPIDQAAETLGFNSGSEMLFALKTMPSKEEYIDQEADRQMLERHPEARSMFGKAGDLFPEAMDAVHSKFRSKLLITELKLLASEHMAAMKGMIRRITRPIPTMQQERADAEREIGTKKVQDIAPSLYIQAEARDSREAGIHFSNGDIENAFESKYRELLNHERYRAAVEAQDYIDKALNYVRRLNKESARDRIAQASGGQVDYMGQIDDILERFDFRQRTLKTLAQRESLREFVKRSQDEGYSPSIPEDILNDANRQHYKELPFNEFKDVIQSLKTIQNLAELKGQLLANAKEKSFDAAKEKIIADINENHDVKLEPPKPRATNETSTAKAALASQTRMEFLFDRLAGYKPLSDTYQILFKPTVDAQTNEREMMIHKMYHESDGLSLNDIFSRYTTQERALWYMKKTYIPQIDSDMLKPNILMAALNLGNEYNRNALKEGYKWSDAQLKAVTDHLDKRDWETVQKIWDHLETYRDPVGKLEKRLNGQEPEWVQAKPFEVTVKNGQTIQMRGGYFPVMFDPKLSPEQARLDEKAQAIDLFGGQYAQAMTKFGHTIARTNTGGKPLLLQLSALTGHIENVIHDLNWRETIIDLNRMINDPDVRANIKGAVGDENYGLLNPWLRSVAGEKSPNSLNPYEQLLGQAKGMATAVRLGFSITAGLKHLTNYGMSINEVGILYATRGLISVYGKPWNIAKQWQTVTQASKQMAAFDETYDRDVRDMFKGMNIAGTREGLTVLPDKVSGALSVVDAYTHDMQKAFFWHFGYMYKGVALPAWLGAYQKAIDGKVENAKLGDHDAAVDYADHVVRTTIAAASVKDLPNVMNQRGLMKLFTMYYGPMNLVFNNIQKETHQFSKESIPKLIGASMFLWFGPAAIQGILTGKSPGSNDDSETWIKYLMKSGLMFGAEQFIGLRDAARAIESGGKDFSLSPVSGVLAGITKSAVAASQRVSGEKDEFTKTDIKNLIDTAGYFTGMPTGQMFKTIDYIMDWMTGDEQPDNPLEGAWRAAVGRKTP